MITSTATQHFGRGITEERGGALIPEADEPLAIGEYDRVRRLFQYGFAQRWITHDIVAPISRSLAIHPSASFIASTSVD